MDTKAVLKAEFKILGILMILRSDNGPELIVYNVGECLAEQERPNKHIAPAEPW